MNNLFRNPVNAHLRKATAVAEQCQSVISQKESRLTTVALLEACLFHMHLARVNFLREIAENYQVADAGLINTASELAAALGKIDKKPQELGELETSAREGWLAAFDRAYRQLLTGGAANKTSIAVPVAGRIDSVQLAESELDLGQVEVWLKKLKELVERQREMMVEC